MFIFSSNIFAIDCTVAGLINGEAYYIKNLASGKYLDVAYSGDSEGDNVWTYVGNKSNAQKWRIEQNSNGTITFWAVVSQTGKALSISSSNAVINTYMASSNQKFTVTRILTGTGKGCYKIAIGSLYLGDTNNIASNAEMMNINSGEQIIWSFQRVDNHEASFCGFNYLINGVLFNTTAFNSTFYSAMNGLGYSARTPVNSSATTELSHLFIGNVWIFSGHSLMNNYGTPIAEILFCNSSGGSNGSIAASAIANSEDNVFAENQVIIYLGCTTAATYNSYNLVSHSYLKGAKCVVGTTLTITSTQANTWINYFSQKAATGATLLECINNANSFVGFTGSQIYIAGDTSQKVG